MRRFIFICLAVFLCFSCSSIEPVHQEQPDMLANVDPIPLDTISVFMDQTLSPRPKENTVEVIFHPRENAIALEFKHEFGEYWQYWNEEARQRFIESVNKYNEDLANKKLTNDYRKSRRAYGTVRGRAEWISISLLTVSEKYRASPEIELGYRFRGDTPYFSTYQKIAKEETKINKDITESWQFPMYFTQAQSEELVKLFDQVYLLELLENWGVLK